MEKHEKILDEQQAPVKNSDHAFVQVGKDGHPVIPDTTEQGKTEDETTERSSARDKQ